MRSRLRRLLLMLLVAQAIVGVAALLAMQSPWRSSHRPNLSESLVHLAAAQLREESLVSVHPETQRILDKAASTPSVRFAAIVDAAGTIVRIGGEPPKDLRLGPDLAGANPTDLAPRLVKSAPAQNLQVFRAPLLDELGRSRWLVMGVQDVGAQRALLDGAWCIGIMIIFSIVLCVPLVLARFGRWTDGLHQLHTAIRRLALGSPCKPVAITGDDEVAYLGLLSSTVGSEAWNSRDLKSRPH